MTKMTTAQAREVFNQAIAAAQTAQDPDAVAKLELCREYFTNETFRKALGDYVFELTYKAC